MNKLGLSLTQFDTSAKLKMRQVVTARDIIMAGEKGPTGGRGIKERDRERLGRKRERLREAGAGAAGDICRRTLIYEARNGSGRQLCQPGTR